MSGRTGMTGWHQDGESRGPLGAPGPSLPPQQQPPAWSTNPMGGGGPSRMDGMGPPPGGGGYHGPQQRMDHQFRDGAAYGPPGGRDYRPDIMPGDGMDPFRAGHGPPRSGMGMGVGSGNGLESYALGGGLSPLSGGQHDGSAQRGQLPPPHHHNKPAKAGQPPLQRKKTSSKASPADPNAGLNAVAHAVERAIKGGGRGFSTVPGSTASPSDGHTDGHGEDEEDVKFAITGGGGGAEGKSSPNTETQPQKPKIKRNRIARACVNCRQKKTKVSATAGLWAGESWRYDTEGNVCPPRQCDGAHPMCGQCVAMHFECAYDYQKATGSNVIVPTRCVSRMGIAFQPRTYPDDIV
jgi:hypothetical protein